MDGANGKDGKAGAPGVPGADGVDGKNGTNGKDGADGKNGINALTKATSIDPGDECPEGGARVQVGTDDDGNGKLDDAEISDEQVLCAGKPGKSGGCSVLQGARSNDAGSGFWLSGLALIAARLLRRRRGARG
jgi:hypothetical protein